MGLDGDRFPGRLVTAAETVDLGRLAAGFEREHGLRPRIFSAPGRVNLIGEHTDYNDGFVLPMAIERRTYVAAAPRPDRKLGVRSLAMNASVELDLDHPGPARRGRWYDYVEGTAQALIERGFALAGASLVVASDVPRGAGLSSSAALELAVARALAALSGEDAPDLRALAFAGRTAEHRYVGTLCGIMDQWTCAFGREQGALLIDCRSLTTEVVPIDPGAAVVICDSGVKHALAASAYNERRQQCQQGVELLKQALPKISALRDVTVADLEAHAERLPEPLRRRCRHVVTEIARTLAAARALQNGRLAEVGALMRASHASLRDDYEVSCPELDLLVALALAAPGVYGARLTGGGFGGCTVNLVAREAVEPFTSAVAAGYARETGRRPAVFVTRAAPGVMEHFR